MPGLGSRQPIYSRHSSLFIKLVPGHKMLRHFFEPQFHLVKEGNSTDIRALNKRRPTPRTEVGLVPRRCFVKVTLISSVPSFYRSGT